jgi:hypothetical protein
MALVSGAWTGVRQRFDVPDRWTAGVLQLPRDLRPLAETVFTFDVAWMARRSDLGEFPFFLSENGVGWSLN